MISPPRRFGSSEEERFERTSTAADLGSSDGLRGRQEGRTRGVGTEARRRRRSGGRLDVLRSGGGLGGSLHLGKAHAAGALLEGLGGGVAASEGSRRLDEAGLLVAASRETYRWI